jgi:hypothetical protein
MIDKIYNIAKEAIETNPRQAGIDARWYENAGSWCNGLDADYDLPPGTVAGYVAALSPLNSWDSQLKFTPGSIAQCLYLISKGRRPHEGITGPGFFSNRDKAARILQGEAPLDVLGGDKVRAFFRNLTGDYSCVTIDRHAIAITGWDGKGLSAAGVPTSRLYSRVETAYKFAGESLDLTGPEIQALTWSHWRRYYSAYSAANLRRE